MMTFLMKAGSAIISLLWRMIEANSLPKSFYVTVVSPGFPLAFALALNVRSWDAFRKALPHSVPYAFLTYYA